MVTAHRVIAVTVRRDESFHRADLPDHALPDRRCPPRGGAAGVRDLPARDRGRRRPGSAHPCRALGRHQAQRLALGSPRLRSRRSRRLAFGGPARIVRRRGSVVAGFPRVPSFAGGRCAAAAPCTEHRHSCHAADRLGARRTVRSRAVRPRSAALLILRNRSHHNQRVHGPAEPLCASRAAKGFFMNEHFDVVWSSLPAWKPVRGHRGGAAS